MTAPSVPHGNSGVVSPAGQQVTGAARTLPEPVRLVIAKSMGYKDEAALYYWGSGGAVKQFDDTCAALAVLWPTPEADREKEEKL